MLDVLQIVKDEILDDRFVETCKDFTAKFTSPTTIVFVINTELAQRHLLTLPSRGMFEEGAIRLICTLAHRFDADAILSVTTSSEVKGQRCMIISVETLLDRYAVVYPYERTGAHEVVWRESLQLPLQDRYGDLLPTPEGMAQA
jgi:hypothetical protein